MIGFAELLIVLFAFSLPAVYLFIVSRFIKESEEATTALDARR
jgi:hypothetical protein